MTTIGLRSQATSLVLGAALALGVVAPVLAEHGPARLGLTPIGQDGQFFAISLRPGESAELRVEVANFGHDEVLARTYAADVYSIINGGFGAELFREPPSGATEWLDYPDREIPLVSTGALIIEFGVTVPTDTPPGEYIAALVAEDTEPYRGDPESVAVEQVNRVAVAVAIDVPGPRAPGIEIGAVGHKLSGTTSSVTFEVANTGNAHLWPHGGFILRDSSGTDLASAPAIMDSVYAASATLFEAPLAQALEPGTYCAELSLADDETGVADSTECLTFTVASKLVDVAAEGQGSGAIPVIRPAFDAVVGNPVTLALSAIAAVSAAGAVWLLWRRRRRTPEPG